MKNWNWKLFIFITFLVLLACIVVVAQTTTTIIAAPSPLPLPLPVIVPVPLPTPSASPGLIGTVGGLLSLAKGWQSLGVFTAIATALKLITDLGSLSFVGSPLLKLPVEYQLLVKSFVAAIIALLGFMAAGVALPAALPLAIGSAAGSGFIHELIADFFPQLNTLAQSAGLSGPST